MYLKLENSEIYEILFYVFQCFGHISHAHINPAITLGSVVLGIKTVKEGLFYVAAQFIGASIGYGLLKVRKHIYI